jgi:hypothetical protein
MPVGQFGKLPDLKPPYMMVSEQALYFGAQNNILRYELELAKVLPIGT